VNSRPIWQRDLSVSYGRIGKLLASQGKLDEALKSYRDSLTIAERLAALDRSNSQWQNDLHHTTAGIDSLAYGFVLARDFARALEVSDLVMSVVSDQIWVNANRAHALMFLGRVDEARTAFRRNLQGL
jgi:tetratricopeptide (TPR) repeat protein